MKILVTGAAGFIGYHLVKELLAKGDTVIGIDNLNSYYDVNLKYARLNECGISKEDIGENNLVESTLHNRFSFEKCDIVELPILEDLFSKHQFDYVFHMAAQPGVRYSLENPNAYIQSNIVAFMNILECCRHYKIKHLVYASSSSIYGMNDKIPFSEDDRVDYPVSIYAATKKSNELMAYSYSHLYKLPTTGLRFFTVYGPWGRPDMAPMLFANAMYCNMPIKVFNGGDLKRDFTYIDDIIKGVVKVADHIPSFNNSEPFYNIFNIGNSEPVQLMSFIKTMENIIGVEAQLEMCPMQAGDVHHTFADTSKLENEIGYKPATPLHNGLSKFISWYKSYFNAE